MHSFLTLFACRLDGDGLDLLQRLLALNSKMRITAKAALAHPFFDAPPKACSKSELPMYAFRFAFCIQVLAATHQYTSTKQSASVKSSRAKPRNAARLRGTMRA